MQKRTLVITSLAVLVTLLVFSVAPALAQAGPTATVNTGALHVRSGPGIGFSVVFSIHRGTPMTLLARNNDASWVKVVLSNGIQGWVNSFYIATTYPLLSLPTEGTGTPPSGAVATVSTGALNIRSGPGLAFGRITSVFGGTQLTLLARTVDSSWVKVMLSNGTVGWVNVNYITTFFPIASLPAEGTVVNPPPQQPPQPSYRTHVVQPGENLFRIALRYGVNMYQLAALNGIVDVSRIYAGQVLIIPVGGFPVAPQQSTGGQGGYY